MARRTYKRSRRLPPEEMEPRVEDQPIPMDQPMEMDQPIGSDQPVEWSPEWKPGKLRQAEALHSNDEGRCYVWPERFFNPKDGSGRKRIMMSALASTEESLTPEGDVSSLHEVLEDGDERE